MRTRVGALVLLLAVSLAACTDDADPAPAPTVATTTAAECADVLTDEVFATLGWTPTGEPAESTLRGCRREAEQGYVEVRARTGYDKLCATLDRTEPVGPGVEVDWLEGRTACAVEPEGDVGQTVVVVRGEGDAVTQVMLAVLAPTPREKVRAAVALVVG